ncbi:MAG TPA: Slp family lipoprotein [Nitrospira sp.]|nr:Slp family lipoprotein [Nitrospira sp.]
MTRGLAALLAGCTGLLLAGCAQSAHQTGRAMLDKMIPDEVLKDVDQSVSFAELREDPGRYTGKTVMFSGLAMRSRRTKDGTEIEVLQIPTDPGMAPSERKAQSQGRFLAVQSEGFLDPATIEKGTPLTIVGTVTGATSKELDDSEYRYPVLNVRYLVDWNDVRTHDGDGYSGRYYYSPYASWYYGFGSPFWGPYGFYPYSYYGPYYSFPFGYSVPAPAPPPPSSVPPQFRKSP